MPITVEDDEAQAIRQALDNYLPELRFELSRTEQKRERHSLAELESKLTRLRQRLG